MLYPLLLNYSTVSSSIDLVSAVSSTRAQQGLFWSHKQNLNPSHVTAHHPAVPGCKSSHLCETLWWSWLSICVQYIASDTERIEWFSECRLQCFCWFVVFTIILSWSYQSGLGKGVNWYFLIVWLWFILCNKKRVLPRIFWYVFCI